MTTNLNTLTEREPDCTDSKYAANHKGESWREYDARGIYLCKVCEHCEEERLGGYRPEILTGYDQSDVTEPIEPEDC